MWVMNDVPFRASPIILHPRTRPVKERSMNADAMVSAPDQRRRAADCRGGPVAVEDAISAPPSRGSGLEGWTSSDLQTPLKHCAILC